MSDVREFLAHYGVKGMKWGVRKKPNRGPIRRGATKANTALGAGKKVIEEGEKKLIFLPQTYRNMAATQTQLRVLGEARAVNKSPRFKGKDLKNKPALKKEYHNEIQKRAKKIYEEELADARGEAVVDFVNAVISPRGDRMDFSAPSSRIRHAEDGEEILLTLALKRDELDQIVDTEIVSTGALAQSDELGQFLAHYGIKGMKWGVRRKRAANGRVSTEAKRADEILNKARKNGGVKSLTNKELGDLNKRLELERKYRQLQPEKKNVIKTGLEVTKTILSTGRTVNDAIAFANSPAGKLVKESLAKK